MAHGSPDTIRWAALCVTCTLGALCCSGPDLTPTTAAAEPSSADPFVVTLPDGAYCGPLLLPAAEAIPVSGAVIPATEARTCPDGTAMEPLTHTALRPLGIGYREGSNPLPRGVAYLTFDD